MSYIHKYVAYIPDYVAYMWIYDIIRISLSQRLCRPSWNRQWHSDWHWRHMLISRLIILNEMTSRAVAMCISRNIQVLEYRCKTLGLSVSWQHLTRQHACVNAIYHRRSILTSNPMADIAEVVSLQQWRVSHLHWRLWAANWAWYKHFDLPRQRPGSGIRNNFISVWFHFGTGKQWLLDRLLYLHFLTTSMTQSIQMVSLRRLFTISSVGSVLLHLLVIWACVIWNACMKSWLHQWGCDYHCIMVLTGQMTNKDCIQAWYNVACYSSTGPTDLRLAHCKYTYANGWWFERWPHWVFCRSSAQMCILAALEWWDTCYEVLIAAATGLFTSSINNAFSAFSCPCIKFSVDGSSTLNSVWVWCSTAACNTFMVQSVNLWPSWYAWLVCINSHLTLCRYQQQLRHLQRRLQYWRRNKLNFLYCLLLLQQVRRSYVIENTCDAISGRIDQREK